ncbi:MAG: hypothetical protein UHS32_05750, partial [Bacteroidaceae bacterium]|nr:hypothetical protein [Bacteroidaceae bacterium]
MKRILKQLCLLWMALCLPASTLWASSALAEASRKGTITFDKVKPGATISLKNQFGNIALLPWDKKDLRLDFELKVMAKNKAQAEEVLNDMGIVKRAVSGAYSLELRGADGGSNEERKIESHWTVYIPKAKFALIVANRFGNVNIPDYACKALSAHVKFGALQCGNLQTDEQKCELKVEHGSLKLTDCKTANVQAKFSSVDITRCTNLVFNVQHAEQVSIGTCTDLNLKSEFCDVTLDQAHNATVSLQHSKLNAKAVRNLNGSLHHSDIHIKEVAETLSIPSAEHSAITASIVSAKDFKSATADVQFGAIILQIPKELEATCQLENEHGAIVIDKGFKTLNHTANEEMFIHSYTGSIGKANASARIKLTGAHSVISLTYRSEQREEG